MNREPATNTSRLGPIASDKVLLWQTVIHIAFLFSALVIALADRVMIQAGQDRH